jgi:hypothetical protein
MSGCSLEQVSDALRVAAWKRGALTASAPLGGNSLCATIAAMCLDGRNLIARRQTQGVVDGRLSGQESPSSPTCRGFNDLPRL